jgi:hypothetical protein
MNFDETLKALQKEKIGFQKLRLSIFRSKNSTIPIE